MGDYLKKKVKGLKPIKEWIDANDKGALAIPYSAAFEHTLFGMDDETKKTFLEENKTVSMLDKIVVNGFKALGLEVFFTSGKDEVKAWVIKKVSLWPRSCITRIGRKIIVLRLLLRLLASIIRRVRIILLRMVILSFSNSIRQMLVRRSKFFKF